MRYMGGKFKVAKPVSAYLNHLRKPGQPYWEPFVGAGYILERVQGGVRFASDENKYLIAMYQALQNGWQPPEVVTEEDHKNARNGLMPDPETAFMLIGCSFAGAWGAGYARQNPEQYRYSFAQTSRRSLLRQLPKIKDVQFFTADFLTTPPPADNCLIYCDPPYLGTKPYAACEPFDHALFWERVKELEAMGHTVVCSEYKAPQDFTAVWVQKTRTDLRGSNGKQIPRIEKLFRHGPNHTLVNPTLFGVGYDEFVEHF